MKAAVCYDFDEPLVVEDVEIDPPQEGEVQVRIAAAAICHSDIHQIRGDWGGTVPVIAGHEAAGIVQAVGENVTTVEPGDHVVVSLLRSCGRCRYCMTGSPHLCEGQFALNTASRLRTAQGQPIRHGLRVAAFAESAIVDQSQLVQVPKDLPMDRAALLGCGVITGVGAVTNTAQVEAGSSVVVIGAGGVGLNAVQGAALSGADPIVAVDLLESKLESALLFGATHAAHATEPQAAQETVRELTSGRGADYVFVTVGSSAALAQGLGLLGKRGTLVIVGLPGRGAALSLPIFPHVVREQRVIGSFMGSTRQSVDIPRLVRLYRSGRLKLDELITARYTLDQINQAIESTETGHALRNVIAFSREA